MRNFLIVFFLAFSVLEASADDLPQGEFALVGDVFLAVKAGYIGHTYAHITIEGRQLKWSFSKPHLVTAENCTNHGICEMPVQSLTQMIAPAGDGTYSLISNTYEVDPKRIIDGLETDKPYIYEEMNLLIDGASIIIQDGILLISSNDPRIENRVVLGLPATSSDTYLVAQYLTQYKVSKYQTEQCGLVQLLVQFGIGELGDAALAARYHGHLGKLNVIAINTPNDQPEKRRTAQQVEIIWRTALANAFREIGEADLPRSEIETIIIESAISTIEGLGGFMKLPVDKLKAEIVEEFREELIAMTIMRKRMQRFEVLSEDEKLLAYCEDINLSKLNP